MKKFDYLVFIGRFQPFHLGHMFVVKKALELADRIVLLVGSSFRPKTFRDPWSYEERKIFIRSSFESAENENIIISPLLDYTYNDQQWIKDVQQIVYSLVLKYSPDLFNPKIGLIGHKKDHTSYYLSMFPQWDNVDVSSYQNINATTIREEMFKNSKLLDGVLSFSVKNLLENYLTSNDYKDLLNEYQFIKKYQKSWENAPYPPIFVTVDAIVLQSGHILIIKRKANPGKGLLALPGGFIKSEERLQDAIIRELREETKIKVPSPVLNGNIKKQMVFDYPYRSQRGRTITHVYLIELSGDESGLPKVKGNDDAKEAFWLPLSKIKPENMFEDHFYIIQAMI